jgi:hypothetical protein
MIMKNLLICNWEKMQISFNISRIGLVFMKNVMLKILIILFIIMNTQFDGIAQIYKANPSNWLFLEGNVSATKQNIHKSEVQSLDSIVLKWSTPLISGQVQPLIGNIINNPRISENFIYAPNEIAAVMGERIVIINGTGKLAKIYNIPQQVVGVKGISLLLDTLSTDVNGSSNPCVMVTESMETSLDTLASSYIFTYDTKTDSIYINRRLTVDMRPYKPNIYASVKPFAGKKIDNEVMLYATVNTHTPKIPYPTPAYIPFLRGLVKFNINSLVSTYPMPDIGDDLDYRVTLGPEVNRFTPSISSDENNNTFVVLPTLPSIKDTITVANNITLPTLMNKPYLLGFDITGKTVKEKIAPRNFTQLQNGNRPLIRPYIVKLTDKKTGVEKPFVLVGEEYSGLDSSKGQSQLYLYTIDGDIITIPNSTVPPFVGEMNHYWSIATGNIDGNPWNDNEYYPNNPGNEIVLTQSTRDFAYPTNKLMILKYQENTVLPKPHPVNMYLRDFDTICTARVNGWVAAVNDIDANPDGKDEIFLVDGGTLKIMKMRDYNNPEFQEGRPFDTLFTHTFENQTIFSVEVADLEGDGKKDIVITTNDSTYVFGSIIPNSLKIIYPDRTIQQTPPETLCYGDTLQLKWINYTLSEQKVQIRFQKTVNSIPTWDTLEVIDNNVLNNFDTVTYKLVIDDRLSGKEGFFVISGFKNPRYIVDTTATFSFEIPRLIIDDKFTKNIYKVDDSLKISGTSKCVDSISLEISIDKKQWTNIQNLSLAKSNDFVFSVAIPCLPIFDIKSPDTTAILYTKIIYIRQNYLDSTAIYNIIIQPKHLAIVVEPCPTNCPTLNVNWDTLSSVAQCDSIYFLIAETLTDSLKPIGARAFNDGAFSWNLPSNLANNIRLRASCQSGCAMFDTLLVNVMPKYINIVSPNPFQPYKDVLDIVYKIPKPSNVSIKIIDQGNRVVKEIINNKHNLGNIIYCEKWDGLNTNNELVANGLYYILLELSDGTKDIYPVFVRK